MPPIGFKHTDESKRKMSVTKRSRNPISVRFWSKVDKNGPGHTIHGQCWIWTASKFTHGIGYGQCSYNGKNIVAHRVSWSISNGEIPKNSLVLHKCDNPICVRPDHLFLGTHKDNMQDMYCKGRNINKKGEEPGKVHRPASGPQGQVQGGGGGKSGDRVRS